MISPPIARVVALTVIPMKKMAARVLRRRGPSVPAKRMASGGPPIPVTYEMHLSDGEWKVYDVSIDGVSLVINYRSSFTKEIRRNGLDGLIERLSRHNAEKG